MSENKNNQSKEKDSKEVVALIENGRAFIMGKRKWRGKGGNRGGGRDQWKQDGGRRQYEKPKTENARFEKYYQEQGLIPEGDWAKFMEWVRNPLHITFRINLVSPFGDKIREELATSLQLGDTVDGEAVPPPAPVEWYPGKAVWQIGTTPRTLKKSPQLKVIHKWLVQQQAVGNVSRQELVSMVPPLFLDPQATDRVFDMCASPGSKTMQILEIMHSRSVGIETDAFQNGLVVANDIDNKRAHLLVHQVKRLGSPHLVVANHPAQMFPLLGSGNNRGSRSTKASRSEFFDRVLCDVPCSGDGTIRKQPEVWSKWTQNNGAALHPLQVTITLRGLALLKPGGTLVYSTCSFNPSENEAVVAEVLRQCKGSVELVDASDRFPLLRRAPGVSTWKVAARSTEIEWLNSFADVNPKHADRFTPSMWPPTPEEAAEMHLERCMRFYPHFQDTGGFFVCVLRKKPGTKLPKAVRKAVAAEAGDAVVADADESATSGAAADNADEEDSPPPEKRSTNGGVKPKDNSKGHNRQELAFHPLPQRRWNELRDYFGLKPSFSPKGANLFLRGGSQKVITYFSNSIVEAFCTPRDIEAEVAAAATAPAEGDTADDDDGGAQKSKRAALVPGSTMGHVKIVSAGVKAFEVTKRNMAGPYRLRQEGVHVVLEHMTKRKVQCTLAELSLLLAERPKVPAADGKGSRPAPFDFSLLTPATATAIHGLEQGSFVFEVVDPAYPRNVLCSVAGGPLAMVAWKNSESFNMMVVRSVCYSLQFMCCKKRQR